MLATGDFGRFQALIEPNEDREGVQCFVFCGSACSSLAVVEDYGKIEPDERSEVAVPRATINRIRKWAEGFGY